MNSNCPMYRDYFNPEKPIRHDKPVHHSGIQAKVQDYPAECLWAQLQWEREQAEGGGGSPKYRENLKQEWSRRDVCSRCLQDLDHPFMIDVDSLRHAEQVAEGERNRG